MWGWKKKTRIDGFPKGFKVQRIGVTSAVNFSHLSGTEIVSYFRDHPGMARGLLMESDDKRYVPTTIIAENTDGSFRVGWITRDVKVECVKQFANLADAATDYILFSLGKSRWSPTESEFR